jgi:hypothetical protein
VVSVLCGFFGALASWLSSFQEQSQKVANPYAAFPSLARPWLAGLRFGGTGWVESVVQLGGLLLMLGNGLLVQMLVRTPDRVGDMLLGMATGFLMGLTACVLLGPAAVVNSITAIEFGPPVEAYQLWGVGATQPPTEYLASQEKHLLRRYPDLRSLPSTARGNALIQKLKADLAVRAYEALWWTVFSTLAAGVMLGAECMVFTGFFRRREYRRLPGNRLTRWVRLLPFVELAVLTLPVLNLLRDLQWGRNLVVHLPYPYGFLNLLIPLLFWGAALLGAVRGWPSYRRYSVYLLLEFGSEASWAWGYSRTVSQLENLAALLVALAALNLGSWWAAHKARRTVAQRRG